MLGFVLWCAAAGYLAGWLWMDRWQPPSGQVLNQTWYPDPWDEGNRASFDATAYFVLISVGLGLVIAVFGLVISRSRELLTVSAVLVGACAASWVMIQYGVGVSPADPAAAAARAPDGTPLLGSLAVPAWSTRLVLPAVSLLVLGGWLLLVTPRSSTTEQ